MIHKGIEAFSVGLQISKSNSRRLKVAAITILIYSLMTPVGSIIGMCIQVVLTECALNERYTAENIKLTYLSICGVVSCEASREQHLDASLTFVIETSERDLWPNIEAPKLFRLGIAISDWNYGRLVRGSSQKLCYWRFTLFDGFQEHPTPEITGGLKNAKECH
uniref:Uncharacterized protein n=1 Tax=Parascaris equorum TaxID=6256 RepID=A0A914RQ51_PAREQ